MFRLFNTFFIFVLFGIFVLTVHQFDGMFKKYKNQKDISNQITIDYVTSLLLT